MLLKAEVLQLVIVLLMKPDLAIKTHLDENIFILNHQGIRDDKSRERLGLVAIRAILKFTSDVL